MGQVAPVESRKVWLTLEPVHVLVYVAPEAREAYAALGLSPESEYFASRSAPLGHVPPDVVTATFFNFSPTTVRRALTGCWDTTSPGLVLEARLQSAGHALRRILGADTANSAELRLAADLSRQAALAAGEAVPGRPLFAAHAALPWPDEPLQVLWHGQTLLREFRGDGHVGLLMTEGVGPTEALLMDAANGGPNASGLKRSRGWTDDDWQQAKESLRMRGWFGQDYTLTEDGARFWKSIEDRTDRLAVTPFESIGNAGCDQLRKLVRPWSRTIVGSGAFTGAR